MYEVLDKDTIKSEILPHLSVTKRGFVSKSDLAEVIQFNFYKLKTGCQWHILPVSSFFAGRLLHYKTVYGHFRKWSRNGEWEKVWGIILHRYWPFWGMSCVELDGTVTPPRFVVGSAVDTKYAREERPPMPSMTQTGKAYRLSCPHLFRVLTTTFTTSPWFFRICSQGLRIQACPYRGSFSMQMPALTLHYSGEVAISRRCSQTSPSISGEECGEMTSYLMSCFTRRDTALKGPMRGWTHTGGVQQVRYHTNRLGEIKLYHIHTDISEKDKKEGKV